MLASITPLGERGRGRSYRRTVTAYFVGAAAGGAALGAAAAGLAVLVSPVASWFRWTVVLVVAIVVVGLGEVQRLPSWRRQVDVRWLSEYRGWVVGLGYGAQLGAAVVTVVPTAATWLTLLIAVASGSTAVALVLCLVFALARALPLLLGARVSTPAALQVLHRRLAGWARPADRLVRLATVAATCGIAVAAGATAR